MLFHSISDEAFPVMGQFFPKFIVRDVESGHWCKYIVVPTASEPSKISESLNSNPR